jgi:hypothetical protein
MIGLLQLLGGICGIGSLVCFILVIVKMFQNGENGLGIACLLLLLLCGIGFLVTFIYGWINVSKWGIKNIMMIWSACVIAGILCNVLTIAAGGAAANGIISR